jgi:prepilin-type N-terminal cleavage/methylation domain-containing protein
MRDRSGMTLIELLVVMGIATLAVTATVFYSVPLLAKETLRGALNDAQSALQIAKIEAASRNRSCRFVVDTQNGTLEVWDGVGTATLTDDVQLYHRLLPESVGFARPDSGSAITLQQIGGSSRYEAVLTSTGIVTAGAGVVCLAGGAGFGRMSVHAAGGVELERWDGYAWQPGA